MYQKVVIVGNLGADPEMRYTAQGKPVTTMSVATNRKWTDAQDQAQEETVWWRVTVWGKQAETCNQYLAKGRQVLIEGRIRTSVYQGKDGETRHAWELVARDVKFLGKRAESASEPMPERRMAEPVPF